MSATALISVGLQRPVGKIVFGHYASVEDHLDGIVPAEVGGIQSTTSSRPIIKVDAEFFAHLTRGPEAGGSNGSTMPPGKFPVFLELCLGRAARDLVRPASVHGQ